MAARAPRCSRRSLCLWRCEALNRAHAHSSAMMDSLATRSIQHRVVHRLLGNSADEVGVVVNMQKGEPEKFSGRRND
jgi:hypothetical protein